MYSYLILSLPFVAVAVYCLLYLAKISLKHLVIVLAITLILTAIFDSLIIWAGIYSYNSFNTLGLVIGKAPIEDFFYMLFAVGATIFIWEKSQ